MTETRLKLAIQKSGRLADDTRDLLDKCGIGFTKSRDQLFCTSQNFPIDLFFVRDDDIPAFVASGVCQIGIVGQNVLSEEKLVSKNRKLQQVDEIMELGFGRCRLALAAPHDFDYQGADSLEGKTIATSYAGLLGKFLHERGVNADIVDMRGAVEIAPRVGVADVVCDLVSTGATLAVNGLREVETLFKSQSVLIAQSDIDEGEKALLGRLMSRLRGVLQASNSKYIMFHAPVAALEEIRKVIPGSESPTILQLQNGGDKVAVHAVCNEGIFWETMEDLRSKGATDILVVPIEKMLE